MNRSAVGRVVKVFFAYAVIAVIALVGGFVLQDLLLLPQLFIAVLAGFLALGLPIALAVAFRYPEIGVEGARDSPPG